MTPIPNIPTKEEIEVRAAVEYEIGRTKMQDFELWAFNRSPVAYNENITFLFLLSRNVKMQMPDNHLEAIATIIHLWKHRNDWKRSGI